MRKLSLSGLVAILFANFLFGQNIKRSDYDKSVVQILMKKTDGSLVSYGTGFFVRQDGIIASAFHVYVQALNAIADNRGGQIIARRLVRQSEMSASGNLEVAGLDVAHDLILFKATNGDSAWNKVGGIKTLSPSNETEIDIGTSVIIVGNLGDDGFPITLSGYLAGSAHSTIEMEKDAKGSNTRIDFDEFLVSAFVVPGHSGSPVILSDGSVLGIVTSIVPLSLPNNSQQLHSGLCRVIKAEHLQRLLSSLPK